MFPAISYIVLWTALTLLERFFPAQKGQALFTEQTGIDALSLLLNKMLLRPVFTLLQSYIVLQLLTPYVPHHIIADIVAEWHPAVKFAAAIFLIDLAQYLRHRFMHAVLWDVHATHHSATELRASVHWRLHPVDTFFIGALDAAFLWLLGFPGKIILWAQLFMALHNMWLHANLNIGYGPLRRVFVSPNYHKWHHARDRAAIDRNFADLFVILDIIGRSHYDPVDKKPSGFGIAGQGADAGIHRHYVGALVYPLTQWRARRRARQAAGK